MGVLGWVCLFLLAGAHTRGTRGSGAYGVGHSIVEYNTICILLEHPEKPRRESMVHSLRESVRVNQALRNRIPKINTN